MRTTRLAFMSLVLSGFVSACAPSGGSGEAPAGDPGGTFFATMSLMDRDLSFASHVLLTLSDVRRTLDDAQTLFPNTRQQTRPGDVYEFGCRNLKKIFPDPEAMQPTTNEKFAILYNCLDGAQKFARVGLRGSENYDLGYPEPLPLLGDPKPRPIANSIVVEGQTNYVGHIADGMYKGEQEVRVLRKTTFRAQMGQQTLADLVFSVDMTVEDTYSFDVSRTYREGLFTTHVLATAVVDKKSRKVKTLTPTSITITVNGTQYDKAGLGSDAARSNPVPLTLTDYAIAVAGPVKLSADACQLPDAKFVIKKGLATPESVPLETVVASVGGKVSIEGGAEAELKACEINRAADPLYAQVLESLYF